MAKPTFIAAALPGLLAMVCGTLLGGFLAANMGLARPVPLVILAYAAGPMLGLGLVMLSVGMLLASSTTSYIPLRALASLVASFILLAGVVATCVATAAQGLTNMTTQMSAMVFIGALVALGVLSVAGSVALCRHACAQSTSSRSAA